MREIDRIAQEQFDGNVNRAIEHLLMTGEEASFDPYVKTLTAEEAKFALTIIKREMVKAAGGPENYNHLVKTSQMLTEINLPRETVQNAKHNIFITRLLITVAVLLVFIIAFPFTMKLNVPKDTVKLILAIGIGLLASKSAEYLLKGIKFSKIKKRIAVEEKFLTDQEDQQNGY